MVRTRLPIHVVVGPERNLEHEQRLQRLGAIITPGVPVEPPAWASKFHLLAFAKIGSLALTQFDRVWVFDNDMALVGNVDDLAYAPTPAAVWHTAIGGTFQVKSGETCAVTTGLLGLTPSDLEFKRAMHQLYNIKSTYDGGDQGFWRNFYTFYELPVRYHAHQQLAMKRDADWDEVRVLHTISGLRAQSRIPTRLRQHIRYFY